MKSKCILINKTGGSNVLEYTDVELNELGSNDVLIKHKAIGVNYIDLKKGRDTTTETSVPINPNFGNNLRVTNVNFGSGTGMILNPYMNDALRDAVVNSKTKKTKASKEETSKDSTETKEDENLSAVGSLKYKQ